MPKASGHSWRFKARFRRRAFGWTSQPAIARLQEAVSEIRQVSRLEPILGAEGAVALLERISPALENIDSSSGAIGTAVNHTIAELVPILVTAPADAPNRLRMEQRAGLVGAKRELERVKREIEQIIDAICKGVPGSEVKGADGEATGAQGDAPWEKRADWRRSL